MTRRIKFDLVRAVKNLLVSLTGVACITGAPSAMAFDTVKSFTEAMTPPSHKNANIDYSIDPSKEKFYVWVPEGYNRHRTYGLIVYTPSLPTSKIPDDWVNVLTKYNFLFISPQNAGNNVPDNRRTGLCVAAALEMMHSYNIDPQRVYAAGLSGGARNASSLGFWQWDIFKGTIQSCGSNYYRKVASHNATNFVDTEGKPYAEMPKTSDEDIAAAKSNVKFALITGSKDFRHGNVLDIYQSGFQPDGFRARLFDVPGMGHEVCSGATLEQALGFLR